MNFPFISNKPGPEGSYPINLYFSPERENARQALVRTPGSRFVVKPRANVPVRGMRAVRPYLYAVCGDRLYRISPDLTTLELGYLNTAIGPVCMEDSGTELVVTDGLAGYVYNTDTESYTPISASGFPRPSSLTYQDRMFLVSRKASDLFQVSGINDGATWDILLEGMASGQADFIVALKSIARQLHIFGERTKEIFSNTGDPDMPFQRDQGSASEVGLAAPASLAILDESIFFLDVCGRICRTSGGGYQIVSTAQIEKAIGGYDVQNDAIGFAIYWDGHAWYVITFPTASRTWVYDVSTQSWFQWSSGLAKRRHRGNCYSYWQGMHLVGDYQNGVIYELSADVYTDDGDPLRWERTAPPIYQDGANLFFSKFQMYLKTGVGLITGHGIDQGEGPQCCLQWSDDDGRTWGNEHWRSMGKIGEYSARAIWNRLGLSRNRTFRLFGTDAVMTEIYGASLNVIPGGH